MQSTTKAQAKAKALELENTILKWGLGGVLAIVAGYEGGRALHWW